MNEKKELANNKPVNYNRTFEKKEEAIKKIAPEEVKPVFKEESKDVNKFGKVEVSNCNKVNVRSGPGRECEVRFIADAGDTFTMDKNSSLNDTWVKVFEPSLNLEGFIDSRYIKEIE